MNNLLLRRHSIIGAGNVGTPIVGEPIYHPDAFKLVFNIPQDKDNVSIKIFGVYDVVWTRKMIIDDVLYTYDSDQTNVTLSAGEHTLYVYPMWHSEYYDDDKNKAHWFGINDYTTYIRYPREFDWKSVLDLYERYTYSYSFRGKTNLRQIDFISNIIPGVFDPALNDSNSFYNATVSAIRVPVDTLSTYTTYFAGITKVLNVLVEYEFTIIED